MNKKTTIKTLRDEFAMAALIGLLARDSITKDMTQLSYLFADAMLKAREAKNG